MEQLKKWLNKAEFDTKSELSYILSKEEEKSIFDHAIRQEMLLERWRLAEKGAEIGKIEQKLSEIQDWESRIDKKWLLKNANLAKHSEIEESERRKKEKEDRKRLIEKWDAAMFYRLMKANCIKSEGTFIETESTLSLIKTVCFFMSKDKRFETELGFDLKKGLLLKGKCGLGKTFTFEMIKNNPVRAIKMISMLEISDSIKSDGVFNIYTAYPVIYIDDVGTENSQIKHFGTEINWFKDFFEKFYMRGKRFNSLVVSTNLSPNEIEEKYGFRVRSRIKQVFNIINVEGKDLRH